MHVNAVCHKPPHPNGRHIFCFTSSLIRQLRLRILSDINKSQNGIRRPVHIANIRRQECVDSCPPSYLFLRCGQAKNHFTRAQMSTLEGVACNVCNAGVLTAKVGHATGAYAGQSYFVCSNWSFHNQHKDKNDPEKSPWILASDTDKINKYLGITPKRAAPAAAAPAAKKQQILKPAAAINTDHAIVTIAAKIAHVESRLEYLISIVEPKQQNSNEEEQDDEPAE
jgi:hypothetical protein